jgi:hypothetical protein
MTMSIEATFEEVRSHYWARFQEVMRQEATVGRVQAEAEALDAQGNLVTEGSLALPIRHDLALFSAGDVELIQVDSVSRVSFEPFQSTEAGVEVTVGPFWWDWCQVRLSSDHADISLAPLRDWFMKWFRAGADPLPDGTMGAVHFMSDPEATETGDGVALAIDLGTAPALALRDFIAACRDAGARRVTIA